MNIKHFVCGITLAALAGTCLADAMPGTPRREFRGRTYYYQPIRYFAPVWYAGNGIVATRRQAGVPEWPYANYNVRY